MFKSYSPVIISASRAGDIPAFYGEWFMSSLRKGYFFKKNPFNGDMYKILTDNTRAIVFWTKNPEPFFKHLEELNEIIPQYYFQFTLNNYSHSTESNLPSLEKRTEYFRRLSEMIGKERVIWRFDPLILSDKIDIDELMNRINQTLEDLKNYTNKLVFSFIDIENYRKVRIKINKANLNLREFNYSEKIKFAKNISSILSNTGINIASCAEDIDLDKLGIRKNKCIDDQLLRTIFPKDKILNEFINEPKNLKDKGQRKNCNCIKSKDIGTYNTCLHSCVYCYAVHSRESALNNYKKIHEFTD